MHAARREPSAPSALTELPPLSLYVHLPWCLSKCPYCDFNSHTAPADMPRRRYLDALLADLDAEAGRAGGRELVSVFLGGGTPSLFAPAEIRRLLDAVRARFVLGEPTEITLEANPGTLECTDPAGFGEAGVNRLSIGAQSFDDSMLNRLGRIHSGDDVRRSVARVRAAGFTNINLDLMHGLPGQALGDACRDLHTAMRLEPAHISWYQLTLEPNTVFFARPPDGLPDEDAMAEMQVAGEALLSAAGYAQYEVSAYAADGRECRHNLNYWRFGDYLGVGAGAHGKVSTPEAIHRYEKPRNPEAYMRAAEQGRIAVDPRPLGAAERLFEFMLNALRLNDGFDLASFRARTGLDGGGLRPRLETLAAEGLLAEAPAGHWRPTPLGRRFLNDLQAAFLPG